MIIKKKIGGILKKNWGQLGKCVSFFLKIGGILFKNWGHWG